MAEAAISTVIECVSENSSVRHDFYGSVKHIYFDTMYSQGKEKERPKPPPDYPGGRPEEFTTPADAGLRCAPSRW